MVSKVNTDSVSSLSQMVGQELSVSSLDIKQFLAKDVAMLLGGAENLVVDIYITEVRSKRC